MSNNPQANQPGAGLQARIGRIQGRIDEDPNTPNLSAVRKVARLQNRYDTRFGGPEDLAIPPPSEVPIGRRSGGFPGVVNRQGGGPGTTIANPFRPGGQSNPVGGTK